MAPWLSYLNFIPENTAYELQEVKEHTIYEEENEHASAVFQSAGKESPYEIPGSNIKSKHLTKKQQALAKQNQIYG